MRGRAEFRSMKKLSALAAAAVAGLFLFAACSVHVDVALSPNWQNTQTSLYEGDYYEQLTYSLSFANTLEEGETGMRVVLNEAESSYTVTVEAVPNQTIDGTVYHSLYKLTSEYVIAAEYVFTDEDGNASTLAAFGGEHGEPDRVTTETWFHSLDPSYDMQRLQPLRSTRKVLSHTPTAMGTGVAVYNYTTAIVYDATCDNASVTVTDGWGELSEEERKISDSVTKVSYSTTLTLEDLQDDYSVFDNSQLYFMARGLDFASAESGHTVNVAGEAGARTMNLSLASTGAHRYRFYLDNMAVDADLTATEISFTLTGSNMGSSQKVYYLAKAEGASNTYRNLPVHIEEPYDYNLGTMNLTLYSAYHTKAA